jgi:hypothetical protein
MEPEALGQLIGGAVGVLVLVAGSGLGVLWKLLSSQGKTRKAVHNLVGKRYSDGLEDSDPGPGPQQTTGLLTAIVREAVHDQTGPLTTAVLELRRDVESNTGEVRELRRGVDALQRDVEGLHRTDGQIKARQGEQSGRIARIESRQTEGQTE